MIVKTKSVSRGLWSRLFSQTQTPAPSRKSGSFPGYYQSYVNSPGKPVWMSCEFSRFADEAYIKNVIAHRCVNLIANSAASVNWKLFTAPMNGHKKEIRHHPLLTMLAQPNPSQGRAEFFETVYAYKLISGNSYIQAIGPHGENPRELHSLRPDRVAVIAGRGAMPQGYRYTVGDYYKDFPVDIITGRSAILHLKTFHPLDDWYGLSPIEAAAYSIDQHNEAGAWNQALLQHGARPSGALIVRADAASGGALSDEQYSRIKQQMDDQFSGPTNAGRPLLLEGGLDWKEMSLSPKDMDFLNAKHASARDIALAFGVPPQLLGIPGDNTFSNLAEARLSLWEQTILPMMQNLCDEFNQWLVPQFGPRLQLAHDTGSIPALSLRQDLLWARVDKATFLDPNEKRAMVGLGKNESSSKSVKYSPDQARDDHGRWTDGGGDSDDEPSDESETEVALDDTVMNDANGTKKPSSGTLDTDKAIDTFNKNADDLKKDQIKKGKPNEFGDGKCGRYVGLAVVAGGGRKGWPGAAKNFGPWLERNGYKELVHWNQNGSLVDKQYPQYYAPHKGDVVVIQPHKGGKPYGHIAMFNGTQWVSDFKQPGFWPGPGYRQEKPNYVIYRYPEKAQ